MIGTIAHAEIEAIGRGERFDIASLKGLDSEVLQGVENCSAGIRGWFAECEYKFLDQELKMVSEDMQYGGQLDWTMIDSEGKIHLYDLKTSKKVYSKNLIQLCAYAIAYSETTGKTVDFIHILHVDKSTGDYEDIAVKLEDELDTLVDAWSALLVFVARQKEIRSMLRKACKKA
jgi:hypothetical protein